MRTALAYLLVAVLAAGPSFAAEPRSWNKIGYVGGTPPIKADSYDWDTTVSIGPGPDVLSLVVAPSSAFGHRQTLTIKASQITSVVSGPGAWQSVADVPGAQLPQKPHGLFGLLNRRYMLLTKLYVFLAILYQGDDGKPAAILLACNSAQRGDRSLGQVVAAMSGKQLVYAK
jgi:hypothetical protein